MSTPQRGSELVVDAKSNSAEKMLRNVIRIETSECGLAIIGQQKSDQSGRLGEGERVFLGAGVCFVVVKE